MNLEEYSTLEKFAILIGLIILAIIIIPFIVIFQTLWFMLLGWLLKVFAGNAIVHGAAALGITIKAADLPYIVVVLGWVGSFLKTSVKNTNEATNKIKKLFEE